MFAGAPIVFGVGTIGVLYTMASWWGDVIREAQYKGDHTRVVQLHHRYGMILFIASEVMFFVAWFWAYFNAAIFHPVQWSAMRSLAAAQVFRQLIAAASGRRRASRRSIRGICRCSIR